MTTFEITEGGRAIRCLLCERTSYNANDVSERYCGACHLFHDDLATRNMHHALQQVPSVIPLGSYGAYDLYVGLQSPLPSTLIARYGDAPDEYETFNPWLLGADNAALHGAHFAEALLRATAAGIDLAPPGQLD